MPRSGRSRRPLPIRLATTPFLIVLNLGLARPKLWAAFRPWAASVLGAIVIGSVYLEYIARATPRASARPVAVLALALAVVLPGATAASATARYDPAEAVIAAAMKYIGNPFRMGSEGPKFFDCSGFVYRVFADAGELSRIGGKRLRAAGYTGLFHARGRYARDHRQARRGDLVAYTNGRRITHIGIYLGGGKVVSALTTGVRVHSLHGLNYEVSHYLQVSWGRGAGNGSDDQARPPDGRSKGDSGDGPRKGGRGNGGRPDRADDGEGQPKHGDDASSRGNAGLAIGTMNLRAAADPDARVIGWIGRGSEFRIVGRATSPAGFAWVRVETHGGRTGWVYSRWVRELKPS